MLSMSNLTTNAIGRPSLTPEAVDNIFRKLEPYLKSGLSLHKACLEAKVPKSTAYDLCDTDYEFSEKIDTSRNHLTIMTHQIMYKHFQNIQGKQNKGEMLDTNDLNFIKWFASTNKIAKEEFDPKAVDEEAERDKKYAAIVNDDRAVLTLAQTIQTFLDKAKVKELGFQSNINKSLLEI